MLRVTMGSRSDPVRDPLSVTGSMRSVVAAKRHPTAEVVRLVGRMSVIGRGQQYLAHQESRHRIARAREIGKVAVLRLATGIGTDFRIASTTDALD